VSVGFVAAFYAFVMLLYLLSADRRALAAQD
jgi:hypothetical protein